MTTAASQGTKVTGSRRNQFARRGMDSERHMPLSRASARRSRAGGRARTGMLRRSSAGRSKAGGCRRDAHDHVTRSIVKHDAVEGGAGLAPDCETADERAAFGTACPHGVVRNAGRPRRRGCATRTSRDEKRETEQEPHAHANAVAARAHGLTQPISLAVFIPTQSSSSDSGRASSVADSGRFRAMTSA